MDALANAAFLARPELKRIEQLEKAVTAITKRFGLVLKTSDAATYLHLATVSPETFHLIETQLGHTLRAFETCASEDADPWDDKHFFRISMRGMGLTFPADFLDHVGEEDLIEGYDMNRFQIFRNMRFMEKSSYSLLDMLSYDWPMLFERSSAITQKMISYCDEILWAANKTIRFDIPRHYIRELRSTEKQMMEVDFQALSPLFAGPDRPFGLVGTCRVHLLESSQENDSLGFV